MRLDLRQEAAAEALVLTDLPELAPRERQAAIATWKGRMVNEHMSSRVFAALLPQLMRADVSAKRQAAVVGMIADEMRHGRMCAAVVHALGGDAVADVADLPDVPRHDDAEPLEALLRNVLSICCLSETVAVALLSAERQELEPEGLRATLESILADEVQHARFGWTLLDELAPRLDDGSRARLSRYLVRALQHLEAFELAHLPPRTCATPASSSVGVCDGGEARQLLYDTIATVIVPQLDRHGLQATAAWAQARITGLHAPLPA